jgi:methyl-accepting chemotaxis protein
MSSRVIGVRGKLVFALLIIVTLSMWILGLSLMQLMRTAIAEQLNAKAVVIASAIESAIEIGQTRQLGLIGGKGRGFPLGRLLQSFISDPDVSALAVMDSDGKIIASAALNPAAVSLGEDDTGLLKITFSKRSQQQKTALSLIRVIIQLGITALILFVLMSILVNITVLTPVRSLLAITNRIGGGDFSSAVGEVGNDEFGDLGRSFEAMQSRLRESEEKNRQQYESLRRAHHEL